MSMKQSNIQKFENTILVHTHTQKCAPFAFIIIRRPPNVCPWWSQMHTTAFKMCDESEVTLLLFVAIPNHDWETCTDDLIATR